MTLARRLTAEALGTGLLLAAVVGSAIMGERLAGGNVAIVLLVQTLVTGITLAALIETWTPISGAHFNPIVALAEVFSGRMKWGEAGAYVAAELIGAFAGVAAVQLVARATPHVVFSAARSGAPLVSEFVATFGLVGAFLGCSRTRAAALPLAIGAYSTAVYWFTASTSFANPAITLARAATNPDGIPALIVAQLLGGAAAVVVFKWLFAGQSRPQLLSGPSH